jgi:hypothetical protein
MDFVWISGRNLQNPGQMCTPTCRPYGIIRTILYVLYWPKWAYVKKHFIACPTWAHMCKNTLLWFYSEPTQERPTWAHRKQM